MCFQVEIDGFDIHDIMITEYRDIRIFPGTFYVPEEKRNLWNLDRHRDRLVEIKLVRGHNWYSETVRYGLRNQILRNVPEGT